MKHTLITLLLLFTTLCAHAQYDIMEAKRNVVPGAYNFWLYTPEDYYYTQESTPVIIFLHGASLCGNNLNRVRRYGLLDAIEKGREIPAIVIAPQNPGETWNPHKINKILDWTIENFAVDTTRVYVLGMSLGGYGTMDYAGTYPERVAAAMALCGGCTLKNQTRLGEVPLWIMHGTADRAVSVNESKVVVSRLQATDNDSRLRYDWLKGSSHGALARVFYLNETLDWLFSHSLLDEGRPVNRDIIIGKQHLSNAYKDIPRDTAYPEIVQ